MKSQPLKPASSVLNATDQPTGWSKFGLALTGLTTLLILTGCQDHAPAAESTEQQGRPVRVAEAQAVDTTETIRLPASLRASQRAQLAFLQPGYLAERHVERGQRVEAGEVLATLHNPALQPGVAAAEGAVNEARSRLDQLERDTERLSELVERNLASQDALDQTRASRDVARAALEQAQARRDQARNQLLDASLRAPFRGRIVNLMVEPGDFAAAGQPVMHINGIDQLELELQLPGRLADRLQADQIVEIMRVTDGAISSAQVTEIGTAQPGQTAPVIARLFSDTGETWLPGDAVYAGLDLAGDEVLSVPLASIVNPGTRSSKLFRVRNQMAEEVVIETGRTVRGWAQVSGDLQPGDRVIVAGQAQLLDGEPVRIID